MKTLNLEVTVDEANLILEGLGQMPFVKVYAVISKIQEQARNQLNGEAITADAPDGPGSETGAIPSIAE